VSGGARGGSQIRTIWRAAALGSRASRFIAMGWFWDGRTENCDVSRDEFDFPGPDMVKEAP